ncbi:MAG: hypothetical protein V1489_01660 [Candidatus Liptonbacteria bacterium]
MDYGRIDAIVNPAVAVFSFIVVAAFIVLTFVLDYHLRTYSTSLLKLTVLRIAYLGFSVFLLVIMMFSLLFLYS